MNRERALPLNEDDGSVILPLRDPPFARLFRIVFESKGQHPRFTLICSRQREDCRKRNSHGSFSRSRHEQFHGRDYRRDTFLVYVETRNFFSLANWQEGEGGRSIGTGLSIKEH